MTQGGIVRVNRRVLFILLALLSLTLVAERAWAHYSITRRVENLNITLSVIAAQSLAHPEQEDEGDAKIRAVENQFELNVLDISKGYQPVDNAQIRLHFRMLDHDMGEQSVMAEPEGHGSYIARGHYLAAAGHWQILAELSTPDRAEPVSAEFELTVEEPLPAQAPSGLLGLGQSNALILVVGLVLALIVLALATVLWRRQGRKGV